MHRTQNDNATAVIDAPHLLTRREAAVSLKVSLSTLVRLIDRGELPALHIGARVLIRVADVDAFVERRAAAEDA